MVSAYTIKKASIFKRIVAFLFDLMCAFFLFVGIENLVIHPIVNHIFHYDQIEDKYEEKLVEHGVGKFNDKGEFEFLPVPEGQMDYDMTSFYEDEVAVQIENEKTRLDLFKFTMNSMLSEFIVLCLMPLLLGNGQTLGKKLMKLALVSTNEAKVKGWQVFARWAIGIFAFETMINFFFVMFAIIPLPLIVSVILALVTKKGMALHDYIGGTIVVDLNNTVIVDTVEERRKRILEEKKSYDAFAKKKIVSEEEIKKERL